MVHEYLDTINWAVEMASLNTLEPKRIPHPRGVGWWNDACSVAQTLA
jgi:hypothetical protein